MNYFFYLGIIFGLIAALKPFYMHVIKWDENKFIAKAYKKNRSPVLVLISLIGLALIILTWILHFMLDVKYSIVITLLFSITLIKIFFLIFDYDRFHQWIYTMLKEDKKKIVKIDSLAGIFGIIVIIISFILYY